MRILRPTQNPSENAMQTIGKLIDNKVCVEGAVINYKVIFSLSMALQIVANHPLSLGVSSL